MFKLTSALSLGVLLTLATACSKQDVPAPTVSRTASTNSAAPVPTDPGDGGGSDGGTCTEAAPSQSIKDRIKREARLLCADRGWTIVKTISPPDGFTFGIGCPTTNYPYSVDVSTQDGNFAAHGYYNPQDGSVVLGYN